MKLENDFQMHHLFEMYKDQMHCEVVVGIFDSSCRGDDDFDDLEPICAIPPDETLMIITQIAKTYHLVLEMRSIH